VALDGERGVEVIQDESVSKKVSEKYNSASLYQSHLIGNLYEQ
jgi:hypothetical protein